MNEYRYSNVPVFSIFSINPIIFCLYSSFSIYPPYCTI
uniref:Uncharacterized protein n=1 Tax=Siphoviridae sp. ctGDt6 TaxID=2825408 RepID=A0A8S5U813_9CAUD|nr:MAG TPA: hypothetical protein [Siphoviridae sp. ctGDt6]